MLSQMLGQSESKSCSYTAGTNGTKFFVHLCIQRRYEGYLGWHLRSSDKMDIEPDGVEIVTNGKSEMWEHPEEELNLILLGVWS